MQNAGHPLEAFDPEGKNLPYPVKDNFFSSSGTVCELMEFRSDLLEVLLLLMV